VRLPRVPRFPQLSARTRFRCGTGSATQVGDGHLRDPWSPWHRPAAVSRAPSVPGAVSSHATSRRSWLLVALVVLAGLVVASPVRAETYLPREVIVRYAGGTELSVQQRVEAGAGARAVQTMPDGSRRLELVGSRTVAEAVAALRGDRHVAYAVPNYVARASAFYPNDPGLSLQWNFTGPFGINMPEAWAEASTRNAPGGRGAIVAVLDTGVAYRQLGPRRRAPDLHDFVRGYDFVDDDPYPLDANGHGTHVAGTIGEATNNGIGAAGIAYAARIMPVRTLDASGAGDAVTISRGIRYAVDHHADVINMSLEFAPYVGARDVPNVLAALRYARRHDVVVTTVAGNEGNHDALPFPARSGLVIAVAATTADGCQARYSNAGPQVDVAAPGGGPDAAPADDDWDRTHCQPEAAGRSIYQETLSAGADPTRFALPSGYYGTSMAAPHVAGLAALIVASNRLGPHPSPAAVQQLIEQTARDVGAPGYDARYGHGLMDAAAALR
jgi:serine protease